MGDRPAGLQIGRETAADRGGLVGRHLHGPGRQAAGEAPHQRGQGFRVLDRDQDTQRRQGHGLGFRLRPPRPRQGEVRQSQPGGPKGTARKNGDVEIRSSQGAAAIAAPRPPLCTKIGSVGLILGPLVEFRIQFSIDEPKHGLHPGCRKAAPICSSQRRSI